MLRSRLKEMGTVVDDEFLILHILNNLPSKFNNAVENLEECVDSVVNLLGIKDVCQKLSQRKSEKTAKMKMNKHYSRPNSKAVATHVVNLDIRQKIVARLKITIKKRGKRKDPQENITTVVKCDIKKLIIGPKKIKQQ